MSAAPTPAPAQPGVWVVYTWDWHAVVQSVHDDELEARRIVGAQGYGAAAFLPFGANAQVDLR